MNAAKFREEIAAQRRLLMAENVALFNNGKITEYQNNCCKLMGISIALQACKRHLGVGA